MANEINPGYQDNTQDVDAPGVDPNLDDRGSVATFIASSFDEATAKQILESAEKP